MGDLRMKLTTKTLRSLILEVLNEKQEIQRLDEVGIDELSDICYVAGSTHSLATCRLNNGNYYLKFSDSWAFANPTDKSMQIGVEYLAYKIYELYPSNTPENVEVVSDPSQKRIGLATKEMGGKTGRDLRYDFPASKWVDSISGGAMADIFLANWDVGNTSNFVVDPDTATGSRIDPGGALTFRAQGGRKGSRFSANAGELNTMLDPKKQGAGWLLSQVDMRKACEAFLSVEWPQVEQAINEAYLEVKKELENAGLSNQVEQWDQEVAEIVDKLRTRNADIKDQCVHALSEMQ